jgi:hypothetical protein
VTTRTFLNHLHTLKGTKATMGTPISTPGENRRPPAVSLPTVGAYVDVAIVDEEKAPRYEFGSREPMLTADGRPRTKDILTALVIGGTGTVKDDNGDPRPVKPDELVSIHVEGQNRWDPDHDKAVGSDGYRSWSGAKTVHGQLEVGDVVRWVYERDQQGQGAMPRKLRLFRIRRPKVEEFSRTERCEALHRERHAGIPADAGSYDDAPF